MMSNYNNQVFLNCPFDDDYIDLYRACLFTIIDSGFIPRCSKEINNGTSLRINNIVQLIRECRYGIHDLSRVELNEHQLPRFNMPFEYGIFYGSKHFGDANQQKKTSLVFDKEQYRYQIFISDLSGIDVTSHNNSTDKIIKKIRNWLKTESRRKSIPEAHDILNRFNKFDLYIKELCYKNHIEYNDMEFFDLIDNMQTWLAAEPII